MPRSGRPVAAFSPETLQRADTISCEQGPITNRQLARCLLIRKGGIIHSIRYLGYSKVCSKLVPRVYAFEQETEWKSITSDMFIRLDLGIDLLTPV